MSGEGGRKERRRKGYGTGVETCAMQRECGMVYEWKFILVFMYGKKTGDIYQVFFFFEKITVLLHTLRS